MVSLFKKLMGRGSATKPAISHQRAQNIDREAVYMRAGISKSEYTNKASRFSIVGISQDFLGRPMLEIDPAPLSRDGMPEVSDALAEVIAPYIEDDNIAIRFVSNGLPTTMTAVVGTYECGDPSSFITFRIRIMLFETSTKKLGVNAHFQPIRRNAIVKPGIPLSQEITDARVYEFREIYESNEQSQDDLDRLANIALKNFKRDSIL